MQKVQTKSLAWTTVAQLGLLVLLALVGYGMLWKSSQMPYSPHSDVMTYHLASKSALYQSLSQGQPLPFWRSDQLSGAPALTNPQALYLFPLHFLFWLMPPEAAMGLTFWLLLLFSSLGCVVLGAALSLRPGARLLMGVCGLFSFKLIIAVYAGWLVPLSAIVLLPWLWAGLIFFFERPNLGRSLCLALIGVLCLHVGYVQLIYYSTLFALVLWFVRGRSAGYANVADGQSNTGEASSTPFLKMGAYLVLAVLLAIGVSAYLWFPLLAESSMISRRSASYSFFLGGHAFELRHLWTLLTPEALGSPLNGSYKGIELWEDVAYFGIVPLGLVCIGAWTCFRRRYVRFFLFGFLFLFLLASDTFVLRFFFDWVPGFRLFRCPSRLLFLAMYFGIVLAGFGVDFLLETMNRVGRPAWNAWLLLALCLSVISAEGVYHAHRYIKMRPHSALLPKTAIPQTTLDKQVPSRLATVKRISFNYGWAASMKFQLISGYEPYNMRHYQDYFHLMQSGRLKRVREASVWTDLHGIARWDLFHALNVSALLSALPLQLPPQLFKKARSLPPRKGFLFYRGFRKMPLYLYQASNPQPRVAWIPQVIEVKDQKSMYAQVLRRSIQNTSVVLTGHSRAHNAWKKPAFPSTRPTSAGANSNARHLRKRSTSQPVQKSPSVTSGPSTRPVSIASRALARETHKAKMASIRRLQVSPGRLSMELYTPRRQFIRISEVWHPGWRAQRAGRPHPLYRTDIALMGTWIPAGTSRLEVFFKPVGWEKSRNLSIAFLILLLFLLGGVFWAKRSHKKGSNMSQETDESEQSADPNKGESAKSSDDRPSSAETALSADRDTADAPLAEEPSLEGAGVRLPWGTLCLLTGIYALVLGLQVYSHDATNSIDSLFHIRLARLYWERGIFTDFPWMQFSIAQSYWADHHFLYHLLLIPFSWGDLFEGMRASSVVFGSLALTACTVYLYAHRVRFAWAYGLLLLIASDYFFFRISMPRTMSISLMMLVLGLWLLETRRTSWLFPLGFVFIWTYQTAMAMIPMACVAVIWFWAQDKRLNIRPLLYVVGGILLGLTLNPFFPKTFDFLFFHLIAGHAKTQITIGDEWARLPWMELVRRNYPALVMGLLLPLWAARRWRRWPRDIGIVGCGALALQLASLRATRMIEYAVPFAILFGARVLDAMLFDRTGTFSQNVSDGVVDTAHSTGHMSALATSRVYRVAGMLILLSFLGMGIKYHVDLHRHAFDISPQHVAKGARWLKTHTPKDSVVFHTHWVTFAYLFFYNDHNRYISGLNPHFFYTWNPKLHRIYRIISRGKSRDPAKWIQRLFRSRYVFLMGRRENMALAHQLEKSPFAKLSYNDAQVRIYRLSKTPFAPQKSPALPHKK